MNDDAFQQLDSQLCFPLYAAARAMTQAYQPLLAPFGLTYPQYLVLLVLWETDGASVGQIGERLHLDSGTLTPLLKRLEGAELVRRARSSEDERVVRIWLTPKGQGLKAEMAHIPRTLLSAIPIPPETLLRFRGDLLQVLDALRASTKEV